MKFGNYDELSSDFSGPLPTAPSDGVPGAGTYNTNLTKNKSSDRIYGNIHNEELRRLIAEELEEMLKK